jgi:hypothetical protein
MLASEDIRTGDRKDVDDERLSTSRTVNFHSGRASPLRSKALREPHRLDIAGLDVEHDRAQARAHND